MSEYLSKKAVLDDALFGDRINERCPKCGADMIGNKVGDKWCSLAGCDYNVEGDGNDCPGGKCEW